jgi:hypothetical protein
MQANFGNLRNDTAKEIFMNQAANLLVGGLAVGGAVRGGQGLLNTIRRNFKKRDPVQAPLSFQVGTPAEPAPTPVDESVTDFDYADRGKAAGLGDYFAGATQTSPEEFPFYWSGLGLAGAAGLYGGYKGVDALLHHQHQAQLSEEEEAAKNEYAQAMQHLTQKPAMSRDEKLEILYKRATAKEAVNLWPGHLAQAGGAVALTPWPLIALGSGTVAYNIAKSRRKSKLLDKAIKQRQREQLTDSPVFAYAPQETPPPQEAGV